MSNSIDSQGDIIIDNNNKNYNDELYFAAQKTSQNRIFLTVLFYVVTTQKKTYSMMSKMFLLINSSFLDVLHAQPVNAKIYVPRCTLASCFKVSHCLSVPNLMIRSKSFAIFAT